MVEPDKNPEASGDDSIVQIRQIIFGEQIRSWEKQFKRLEQKLNELNKKLEESVKALEARIESAVVTQQESAAALSAELDRADQALKTELGQVQKLLKDLKENKVDKDSIGEVFIQWGEKVKAK